MFRKVAGTLLVLTLLAVIAFEFSVREEKAEASFGRCQYCQKWVKIGRDACCYSYLCRVNKFLTPNRQERPLPGE